MKILYHHRTLDKDGQNVHIDELIVAFRSQGHEVDIVAASWHNRAEFGWDGGMANRIRGSTGAFSEALEYLYSWIAYLLPLAVDPDQKPELRRRLGSAALQTDRDYTRDGNARRINEKGGITDSNTRRRSLFLVNSKKIEFLRAQPRSFCMRRLWRAFRVISSLSEVFLRRL